METLSEPSHIGDTLISVRVGVACPPDDVIERGQVVLCLLEWGEAKISEMIWYRTQGSYIACEGGAGQGQKRDSSVVHVAGSGSKDAGRSVTRLFHPALLTTGIELFIQSEP